MVDVGRPAASQSVNAELPLGGQQTQLRIKALTLRYAKPEYAETFLNGTDANCHIQAAALDARQTEFLIAHLDRSIFKRINAKALKLPHGSLTEPPEKQPSLS